MNCSECRDDFAAYQEGLLEPEAESRTTVAPGRMPGLPGGIRRDEVSGGPSDAQGLARRVFPWKAG